MYRGQRRRDLPHERSRRRASSSTPSTSASPRASSVSFTNLNNGYGVTQFYYGAVFPDDRQYLGGTQDNGTILGTDGGPNAWTELLGGDGGAVAVDPVNPDILYAENTGLSIQKCELGPAQLRAQRSEPLAGRHRGHQRRHGLPVHRPLHHGSERRRGRSRRQRLWTGGSYLWRTTDGAASWQQGQRQARLRQRQRHRGGAQQPQLRPGRDRRPRGQRHRRRHLPHEHRPHRQRRRLASAKPRTGYVSSA